MLFQFDSSIRDFDPACAKHGRALETLLGAFQTNQHVIFIEMSDLRILQQRAHGAISLGSRIALQKIMNRAVEYHSLIDTVVYRIIVYIEDIKEPRGVVRQQNTWLVPLHFFSDGGLLQSAILGENDLDAELFLHLAAIYQYQKKLGSFLLKGRPRSGGGSGTPRVLTSYLRHEYSPCLCVTDSDKLHPTYQQSSTSRNCGRVAQVKQRIVEYIGLDEREIENLLPLNFLKKIAPVEDFLRDCGNAQIDVNKFWNYIDIKRGVSLSWIEKKDEETKKFWQKPAASLSRRKNHCAFCKDNKDENEDREPCHCCSIKGLGDNLLEKTVAHMDANPPKFTAKLFDEDKRWEKIAQAVFAFTIAPTGEMLQ